MATTTTNLGLTQPDAAEGYDVAVFNTNAELIDNAVGALQNELGGTSGGLDAVKTDTEEIKSIIGSPTDTTGAFTLYGQIKVLTAALTTANQNIATLLTQTKGVKAIVSGSVTVNDQNGQGAAVIPTAMNPERVVVTTTSKSTALGDNVTWVRNGRTVTFSATNYYTTITYQFIEFY